jgi:peroxin-5
MYQLEGEKGESSALAFAYLTDSQRYEEAAQYILDALVLQDCDGVPGPRDNRGVTSDALWQSLKSCCLHMERSDLATMCDKQNLEGPFG